MNEEQIIELVNAQMDTWKSTAMFLIGLGSGILVTVLFGIGITLMQRKAGKT